jgi:hypothetical protein
MGKTVAFKFWTLVQFVLFAVLDPKTCNEGVKLEKTGVPLAAMLVECVSGHALCTNDLFALH